MGRDLPGVLVIPGQRKAQHRFIEHKAVIRDAFDSLDLGFDFDKALEYIKDTPTWQEVEAEIGEQQAMRLFGSILAFSMVCVEADRQSGNREPIYEGPDLWG